MVMILVLVLVALLLIVALAIIAGSNSAVLSATAVSVKYRVLNAAEGAANVALNDVASDPAQANGTDLKGSLDGVSYDAWIRFNNLLGGKTETYTDPVTGDTVSVPKNSAYVSGVASDDGGHTTDVEAIAVPSPPLKLPAGTVNAGGDIHYVDPMVISSDPTDTGDPNDAAMYANGSILSDGDPGKVQGWTGAVVTDQVPGALGGEQISPLFFPNAAQVSEAARTAMLSAQGGTQVQASQLTAGGTQSYTGNVYVNGDVDLTSGTITFSNGTYVYVNGNLTIGDGAQIANANTGTNEFVVSGDVDVEGTGAYLAAPKQNSLLLVLGAVTLNAAGASPIGTIFAPTGDITISGPGSIAGALDSGANIYIEGTDTKSGMQYDTAQENTTVNTGALTFSTYIEN